MNSLPLQAKLYAGSIVPMLVLVAIGLSFAIADEREREIAQAHASLESAVVAMTNDLHRAVLLSNQEASVEIAERLRMFESIERLWVVDRGGEFSFAYAKPGLLAQEPPAAAERVGPQWLDVPLEAKGNQLGSVVAKISLDAQAAATARRVGQAIALAAGLLAAGILAARSLSRIIAAPIREVSSAVVEAARTLDTATPISVDDRHEAGAVATAVNYLLREINASRRELEHTNRRIEAQVEQRTRELQASERRIRALATHAPVGIFETDAEGRCIFVNRAWTELCGLEPDDALGAMWTSVIHPGDHDAIAARWRDDEAHEGEHSSECRLNLPHGRIGWVSVGIAALRSDQGEVLGYLGTLSDVTDRKQLEEQLRFGAFHDRLTGLANRARLRDRLAEVIAASRGRERAGYAVLYLDFDRFKWINDTLGHQAGDTFLTEAAARIETAAATGAGARSASALAGRLGGDEFVVILQGADRGEAMGIAAGICEALDRPYTIDGTPFTSTASIGVAIGAAEYEAPDDILRDADAAMYKRKLDGRHGVTLFDESMRNAATERALLERELAVALDRGEFELHYQPLLSLETQRPVGFEALLRWRHPQRGLLAPGAFLAVAEETNLIVDIGRWALAEACRRGRRWHAWMPDQAPFHISVNISARHVECGTLEADVREALRASGMRAGALVVEVTESTIMRDMERSSATLARLRGMGVRVAMDDFGTGYSSLASLRRLPLDTLKIDRSFVTGLTGNAPTIAILKAIIDLAHNLRMSVVAEGIETSEELAPLLALECEMGQGYLFGHPMPADDVPAWCVRSCAPRVRAA